jgi:hypothetical protein
MRKLFTALAAAIVLAVPAASSAASTSPPPRLFGACQIGGTGITYSGTLIRTIINTPSGPLNNILGGENFVIDCQPLSGSVTIQLQVRLGSTWYDRANPARFDFPTKVRGFGLSVGPYLCQGLKTSWRLAIFSSGVAGDGTPWPPTTSWDPAIGGSSGKYFNCG